MAGIGDNLRLGHCLVVIRIEWSVIGYQLTIFLVLWPRKVGGQLSDEASDARKLLLQTCDALPFTNPHRAKTLSWRIKKGIKK